ncbi:MAG: Lysine exporter protein (LYSE/YGGA) [candidate division TM6 bacterium GW2011_GWE2_42_60]|nr:MAG: Lysine exporter protein (LYSE/YGGA) [candidate division TM6 bacterium GW2011_GWE2_42_60]HBY05472.1 lysine transporter LysE [Candidatus Dependentiae bacterium]
MLLLPLFLKALLLGFSVAIPVGPVGLVCIRTTLTQGVLAGIVAGLGAATADLCYAAVAGFGFAAISEFLVGYKTIIGLVGGLFLVFLGFSFLRRPPQLSPSLPETAHSYWGTFLSTFGLTVANPITMLTFFGVFSVLRVVSGGTLTRVCVVVGIFCGALAWWLLLALLIWLVKGKLSVRIVLWANAIAGVLVVGFGAYVVARSGLVYLSHHKPMLFSKFLVYLQG